MVKTIAAIASLVLLLTLARAQEQKKKEFTQLDTAVVVAVETKFDPARNADQDIQNAMAEAKRTGKRIILDVGGEWCGWCHALDRFFDEHTDLATYRAKNYVWLKINYSEENENKEVLSRYPTI